MFPFNLSGPGFLVFYALLAALVLAAFWYYTCLAQGAAGSPRLTDLTADPYKIAYLRDGEPETVRLAIVNLVDRGLLEFDGTVLQAKETAHADLLRRSLDKSVLAGCSTRATPELVLRHPAVHRACAEYEQELLSKGLLLGDEERRSRLNGLIAAVGLLGGLAAARVLTAIASGRTNVLFLIALAAAACWVAYRIYARRTTAAGREALANLETLTRRLKGRSDSLAAGGATNEALLLAAVFGIYALPELAFPFVERMFPKPKPQRADSDGWFSSDSGDGGSSCGGGGGGCGGCGGD